MQMSKNEDGFRHENLHRGSFNIITTFYFDRVTTEDH